METRLYSTIEEMNEAAALIREGKLVAVPTETVYGLCADGLNAKAVAEIYAVKGRAENKPLSLMVSGKEAVDGLCHDVPQAAYALMDAFWPGPLTIILPAREHIPPVVLSGGKTVGLRCPDHPLTLALLRQCARPLAGPSANPSGEAAPVSAEEVLAYFKGKIPAVIDGGVCEAGEPSTILDMSAKPYRILRQGALPEETVAETLRKTLKVIGFTGGTGCGKTTALNILREKGALVLDCDEVYHELTLSSAELREQLEQRFGPVYENGVLNRKKLGAVVFNDAEALADLNAITHHMVVEECERRLRAFAMEGGELAAIDAIGLIESGLADHCMTTVAITAPAEQRLHRIMERDGISEDYASSRMAAQHEEAWFVAHCDHELKNDSTLEAYEQRARELFEKIL